MDFDLVVIGGGPGGYVAAIRAAELGLKTACIDKRKTFGGTCLNVGCIPSKALLQATEYYEKIKKYGQNYGIRGENLAYDFSQMMTNKQKIVTQLTEGIEGLFKTHKVTGIQGEASFIDPHTIQVADKKISAAQFILATGSEPISLPFAPFDEHTILSSTGALALKKVPKTLAVIGAGVIGVEIASIYRRLGAEVTLIEMLPQICPSMDEEMAKNLLKILKKQGLTFHLKTKLLSCEVKKGGVSLEIDQGEPIIADQVLIAVGRRPFSKGLNLEAIGIQTDSRGFIPVDGTFTTDHPHIFAIGDLIEGAMLAHRASDEGYALAESLAGRRFVINYAAIPNVIYTAPEAASVGLTEEEAKKAGFVPLTGRSNMIANPRARCAAETDGFVKVIGDSATNRFLGMHIIASHASEMIGEGVLALEGKCTLSQLAYASHAHPTFSEAIKEAAIAALRTH